MPTDTFPGYPSLADAIADAERVTVRWSHDQVRNLSRAQVDRIVAALKADPFPVSEKGRIKELEATIERMRQRIMGNLADLRIGDYVEVEYKSGGVVKGTVTELWPEHGQARVDSGWCFHPGDTIKVHRTNEEEENESTI